MKNFEIVLGKIETLFFLEMEAQNARDNVESAPRTPPAVWDPVKEKRAQEDLNNPEEPGDLDNLVIRLTPSLEFTTAHAYTKAFMTCCGRFCNPHEFLDRIFERFYVPESRLNDKYWQQNSFRPRVLNIIREWIKMHHHLIDASLQERFNEFFKKASQDNTLNFIIQNVESEMKRTDLYSLPPETRKKLKPYGSTIQINLCETGYPYEAVLYFDEQQIASQLTLIEFNIYLKISPQELLGQAWNKDKRQCIALNVVDLIQRANRVSFWVATCILLQSRAKDRVRAITKFMGVAKHLKEMGNFHTLMGIIAGLNTVSVSRLKHTFENIKKGAIESWNGLMEFMNPSNSFKNLRTAIQNSQNVLPYLGMYLSDLTFLEDGNADEVKVHNQNLINFSKHYMIYNSITELTKFQTRAKDLLNITQNDQIYGYLYEIPTLTEDELYNLSLIREPRES